MNEPTDEELDTLATEIYWHLEHGEIAEARAKLRNLIDGAEGRAEFNVIGGL